MLQKLNPKAEPPTHAKACRMPLVERIDPAGCMLHHSAHAHGDQQRAEARGAEAHGGAYLRACAVEEHAAHEHLPLARPVYGALWPNAVSAVRCGMYVEGSVLQVRCRASSQRRLILHVTHLLHARSTITLLTIVATKKTDPETVTCRVFVIGMHSGPVDQVALGLLLDVAPTNARLWRMLCATQCSMVGCTLRHAACCMLQARTELRLNLFVIRAPIVCDHATQPCPARRQPPRRSISPEARLGHVTSRTECPRPQSFGTRRRRRGIFSCSANSRRALLRSAKTAGSRHDMATGLGWAAPDACDANEISAVGMLRSIGTLKGHAARDEAFLFSQQTAT